MAIAIGRGLRRPSGLQAGLDVPELLLLWRDAELAVAQSQFKRLGREDLEDAYDETADVLRQREHESELHLLNGLRLGLRLRALRLIRDYNTRVRVVSEAAQSVYAEAEYQAWFEQPEQVLLAREDEVVVSEFIADLTPQEQRVFVLISNGLSWRAIATSLDVPETEARSLTRSCERKRERFLTLYQSGRLCGHRSHTIDLLLAGEELGELAVEQALAHLHHCRGCQAEHKITGQQLRARFDQGALALLPVPLLAVDHASWLDRLQAVLHRPVRMFERFYVGNGTVRGRAIEGAAGGAVAVKAAITVGVIALTGAAIEVHHIVSPSHHGNHPGPPTQTRTTGTMPTTSLLGGTWDRPFGSPSAKPGVTRGHGIGHLVTSGEGPGHLITRGDTGPGHLVGTGTGPGHLVTANPRARDSGRPSSYSDRPPGRLVESGTATTASTGTAPTVPVKASGAPSPLGRVLGP